MEKVRFQSKYGKSHQILNICVRIVIKSTFFNYQTSSDNSIKAYRCADELLFYRVAKLCHDGVDFILEFCPTNRNKFDTIKFYSRMYKYDIISYFIGTDDVEINFRKSTSEN